jgi:hypothetical protein
MTSLSSVVCGVRWRSARSVWSVESMIRAPLVFEFGLLAVVWRLLVSASLLVVVSHSSVRPHSNSSACSGARQARHKREGQSYESRTYLESFIK